MLNRVACIVFVVAVSACSSTSEPAPQYLSDGFPVTNPTQRLASIGKACTAVSPATVLAGARLDSLALHDRMQNGNSDSVWYALSGQLPGGFAGVFQYAGVGYVYLADTSQRSE